ncbi:Uncharacterized protein DBV15_10543 [Temnothorax longispinosus]|uniref:Uncharacterized protein n=1 Tax=Temnothorax longispinosus TaxID=300112 RepID=A0A4S2L7E3_9HYME|nr:Uncharacterized protein DBV15_10543 [Temnothorax longispinosus]
MKRLGILIILCVLSAGEQALRVPSSYKNGVKWGIGTNVFYVDILARSNDQVQAVPTVYKKKLVASIARREPVVAAVYKKPVLDAYKKPVSTVYKKELMQNIRQQQSVIPPVFKVHSVYSDNYKSEPVVQNVYKQQAAVPIVRKPYPAVSNVHQFKSQPIQPVVHQEPLLLQDSQKKMQHYVRSYQNNPHQPVLVRGDLHVIPHN